MIKTGICVLMVVTICMLSTAIFAEPDAERGGEIAADFCAKCHDVTSEGPFKQHPPSFAAIAKYRTAAQIYGRIAFPPLHTGMPQIGYMLTSDNIEDMVAYILSLE